MEKQERVLVMGASTNPTRYSYLATQSLLKHGHEVVLYGRKSAEVSGIPILTSLEGIKNIDTVTLYLNPTNQKPYYDFLIELAPKRIIFNPGTENAELMELAAANGIANEAACTLVMLSVGTY
ncbi:CoA-binding protein [bacterium SCSIO 12741]|nr:CoA-binding protein [bacterium SCSIO 12741]